MLAYKCNKCGAEMESPDSMLGKMETCPNCNRRMKVKNRSPKKPPTLAPVPPVSTEQLALDEFLSSGYFCAVAGVTMEGRQKIVRTCREGELVSLHREPNNPHDKDAIALYVERKGFLGKTRYEQVGHIPAEDDDGLYYVAYWMDRGYAALGIIKHVVGGQDGKYFGLRILIEFEKRD